MLKRILSIIMSLVLCIGLMPLPAFAGDAEGDLTAGSPGASPSADMTALFSPDNFKANITKISVGAPITGVDGKKYLPVTATFTANENIGSDGLVEFLEGYVKAALANGATAEGVQGLGMTLNGPWPPNIKPDALPNNGYSWQWDEDAGTGVLKYDIPLLEDGDTQSVEESQETGQVEVNGLKVGDKATLQLETVIKGVPEDMSIVRGNEFTFTIEDASKYPKEITKSEGPEPQEPKNVALAKMVTSDGKVSASRTVSWPKSQASVNFRPGSLEGYTVSPSEHVFTTDGEIFTFTYTPTESVEAPTDTTVTVNYIAPAGYQAPASKNATGQYGTNYKIDTPEIKGLVPSQRTVMGQFGAQNQTFTVSYGSMEMIDDRVVSVPPGNVYTYNGHFQEGVPEHVGYKPAGGSINHARLPGVYQVMLNLSAGYRWSDSSTEPKTVTWAINPAPLSSMVLDRTRFDTVQDLAQKPNVVRVIANGVVVPEGAYSVTYSDETSDQPGIYSVTVTATDSNFSGKLTETYGITQTFALTCPHHGEKVNYMSNGDGATHDEECAYCNEVLVGKDHQPCTFDKVGAKVVDSIDPQNPNSGKPTGQVFLICSKCNQGKSEFETCHHEGTRAFRDNGDGKHTEYCTRCGLDLFVEAHEMVDEAVKTPVANGSGQTAVAYQGTYAHKCSKCSYRELKQCPHEKTHVVRIGGGDYEQHDLYCDKCKAFVERVKCSNFTRTCMNSSTHSKTCAECGSVHGYFGHDWQRQIIKVDAIPRACKTSAWLNPNKLFFTYYDYRIHYTETCKQCKAKRVGAYLYKTNDINGSFNYKKAFQSLVNMSSEDLKNVHSIWEGGGSYLLPVGNALVEPLMSTLQPVTALVGWDSVEYCSLDFAQLIGWEGSTESPGDGYKVYTADGKLVESAKVPGDVPNPAWSVEGGSGAQAQGMQAQEVLPEPIDGANEVPDLDGANEVYITVGSNLLKELPDGPHTLAVCGLLENGERACSVMEFTIETVNTDEGPRKAIKDLHPLGASVDAEGDMVSVQLSTDTVAYTGNPVTLPDVAVTKSQEGVEGGTEPLPQGAYTLAYYRINDVDGEPTAGDQVQVDPATIVEPGSYCVVATPVGNAGWTGATFANFRVARSFESTDATMELEFEEATYTGAEIEPNVTVKATVNGVEQTLTQSYAYEAEDEEQGGETVTTLTQSGAGDYDVRYESNINEGTATVTVAGTGLWMGELTKTFAIVPKPAPPAPVNSITEMTISETSFTYDGTAQKPAVTSVKAGAVEVEPADYSVQFENMDASAVGVYEMSAVAEAGGDFVGSATTTYRIDPAVVTGVELEQSSAIVTGAPIEPIITSVKAGELTLEAGDYTVMYTYANGTPVARIDAVGDYRVVVTGTGNFTGTAWASFAVHDKAPTTIALAAQSKVYTGKSLAYTEKVTKQGSTGAVSYRYYSDSACKKEVKRANVKNVGTYYVKATLEADANYKAATSTAVKLTIVPKATALKKLTSVKRGFVAKWAVQKSQVTGYQLRYATNAKFKKAKTKTVKKYKTSTLRVSKLKAKTKYYVQVRTYKIVGKTTYYSAWSKARAVTTKK